MATVRERIAFYETRRTDPHVTAFYSEEVLRSERERENFQRVEDIIPLLCFAQSQLDRCIQVSEHCMNRTTDVKASMIVEVHTSTKTSILGSNSGSTDLLRIK